MRLSRWLRDDPGIGGIDAIDIGIDIAAVCSDRRGDRHRTCIGPRPPSVTIRPLSCEGLESRDHATSPGGKTIEDHRGANLLNAPRTVLVRG